MRVQKIALEEHLALPETVEKAAKYLRGRPELRDRMLDNRDQLLADMDAAGIEITVLSLQADGIQEILDRQNAIDTARRANDYLAEKVAKHPTRFRAFAAVPLQDPAAASRELERCVKELGFRGVLANGYTQIGTPDNISYYDQPEFLDFFATMESLDVPFYLHARDPVPASSRNLQGHPWLWQSRWAFGVETATHALRMMASGLFDKHPKLTVILGHLGEMLPGFMWRINHRIGAWPSDPPIAIKRTMTDYFQENFYITTSGNFSTTTLMNVIQWMGVDRLMFSVDYPFEKISQAADWFDRLEVVGEADWNKMARGNAERVLKLNVPARKTVSA